MISKHTNKNIVLLLLLLQFAKIAVRLGRRFHSPTLHEQKT